MASPIFLLSSFLLSILFYALSVTDPTASITTQNIQTGFRATLTRVNSPKNRHFLNEITSPPDQEGVNNELGSGLTSRLTAYKDEYIMKLNIGTPPLPFSAAMDTGSDLVWTKCKPNNYSTSSDMFSTTESTISYEYWLSSSYKYFSYFLHSSSSSPQNTSSLLFDPLKSVTFSQVKQPCISLQLSEDCKQNYDDKSSVSIALGQDTLTMGTSVKIPNIIFACGTPNDEFKYDGVVGMGRGKLSLVSQLKERAFSYCMASRVGDPSNGGILLTGFEARKTIEIVASLNPTKIQTIPFLSNNKGSETYYHLSLEGISVGETRLRVMESDFVAGGMIIDSGDTFTSLEDRVVGMIIKEFLNQTKLEKNNGIEAPYEGLDFCFMTPYDVNVIPKMVFHFEGADWELPKENYIYEDESGSQACLAMVSSGDDKTSVLGNMQQQNMMVLYDLDKNSLSFMPAKCNEL
ncbi:hypothetical protein L6452_08639 [Arctium lappa]|uniref:Uncharacterized protein n=1 Tax=Arctium lappa TaxID=4217 RepID=A0ACB9DIH0_ARCLA|nr:hypothetical protein L6452_08639 [Arctium lappa]